ncbi:hypothetical protein ACFW4M_05320 [Streptomyces sp. NPDC058794]|uniref:hypothetical protein n=1 Tax=unclassified Streptomyces TaxID=2593676 RepID=UPI0036CAD13A
MTLLFQLSFVVATLAAMAVAARLVRQAFRTDTAGRPAVVENEALSAGALFGGSMVVTALAAGHWQAVDWSDLVLFAAVFGIATAALIERVREHPAASRVAYVLPVGYGVLAGLTVNGL